MWSEIFSEPVGPALPEPALALLLQCLPMPAVRCPTRRSAYFKQCNRETRKPRKSGHHAAVGCLFIHHGWKLCLERWSFPSAVNHQRKLEGCAFLAASRLMSLWIMVWGARGLSASSPTQSIVYRLVSAVYTRSIFPLERLLRAAYVQ